METVTHNPTTCTACLAAAPKVIARKRGRNPKYPYVPILVHTDDVGTKRESQILGVAYETADEALAAGERVVAQRAKILEEKLADPRHRALREQHGLPREIQ